MLNKETIGMLKNNPSNTQDVFLEYILKNEINLLIYLVNGIKLAGKITAFDKNSLILNNSLIGENSTMLIYKHSISTIVPQGDVSSLN